MFKNNFKKTVATIATALVLIAAPSTVFANNIIWQLSDYINPTGVAFVGMADGALQDAGAPSFQKHTSPGGDRALRISGRRENWNAIDLHRHLPTRPDYEMAAGNVITFRGHIVDAPAGSAMVIGGGSSPWSHAAEVAVSGTQTFTVSLTLTNEHITSSEFDRFRFMTNGEAGTLNFYIYDIILSTGPLAGAAAPAPAPAPTAPATAPATTATAPAAPAAPAVILPADGTATVLGQALNVRDIGARADEGSNVIGVLAPGTTVNVLSRNSQNWIYVEFDGGTGWIDGHPNRFVSLN